MPVTWLLLRDAGDQAFSFDQHGDARRRERPRAARPAASPPPVIQVVVTWSRPCCSPACSPSSSAGRCSASDRRRARPGPQARPRLPALLGVTVLVLADRSGWRRARSAPGVVLAVAGAPARRRRARARRSAIRRCWSSAVYLYVAFALAPAALVLEKQPVRRVAAPLAAPGQGLLVAHVRHPAARQPHRQVIVRHPRGAVRVLVGAASPALAATGSTTSTSTRSLPLIVTALGAIVAARSPGRSPPSSTALLYVDRRMRREALDLELAAGGRRGADRHRQPRPGTPPAGTGRAPAATALAALPAGEHGLRSCARPVELDRDAAGRAAREELAKPVYRDGRPEPGRAAAALGCGPVCRPARPGRRRLAGRVRRRWSSSSLVVAVAVVALRLRLGPLRRTSRPRRRRCSSAAPGPPPSTAPRPTRTPPRASGPRRCASGCAPSSAALEERACSTRGRAAPPTRPPPTPARRCPAARPTCARAARLFDDVWYGGRPAGADARRAAARASTTGSRASPAADRGRTGDVTATTDRRPGCERRRPDRRAQLWRAGARPPSPCSLLVLLAGLVLAALGAGGPRG